VRGKPTLSGLDWRARWIGKALTIGALVLLLSGLYLILIRLLAARLDAPQAPIGHMAAAVLVALLVVPLRNRLSLLFSRMMGHAWQSSQALLHEIGLALSHTISPEGLYAILVEDLPQRLRLHGATLWMLEPPSDHAFVVVGRRYASAETMLLANGAIARQVGAAPLFLNVPARPDPEIDWSPVVAEGVRLVIPLRVGERLIGFYGCGAPLEGGRYSPRVVNVLLMLAPAAASALENARAYSKIARLNEDLRALDQLKDEFIQSVGHELRTPLTSLSLAMQLLARQAGMPPALSQVTRVGVAQLEALVERVLEFDLRLAHSSTAPRAPVGAVALAPLLGDLVEAYAPLAEAKGMRFDVRAPADMAVWGHAAGLYRVLHEVVDNAVRYSEGGTVTIETVLRDGLVVIRISDEGPGIPHEERDRLFAAFYRGSAARALAATPGAGLGLCIARRDIEGVGGQIWLDHSDASGSTLCVALPAVISADLAAGEPQARAVGA
jgi:signal transduction histidine kinase